MLIETLTGKTCTPVETMRWCCDNGYVFAGQGTSYYAFRPLFRAYGIDCEMVDVKCLSATSPVRPIVLERLKQGYYLIALMTEGLWTKSGHYVVVWWADGKIRINDPASTADKRINGDPDTFFSQAKYFWLVDARAYNRGDELDMTKAEFLASLTPEEAAPIIGFTATPCRLDGKPLTAYNDLIQGLSADDLIRDGYLAPYRLYAPELYDVSRLQVRAGDYAAEDLDSVLRNSALYGDVIGHYKRLADGKQAIAYCATVKQSEEIVAAFCEAGISARHIDGTTPDRERQEALDAFRRGEFAILSNVNLISEGISIPECSVVLGLRPTMSRALYIQQMSRALRWADGKQATLIDYVGNVHRHGMPSAAFVYSLDGKVRSREFDDSGNYFVRTCSACYGTYESRLDACPWTG